mmetsp:Transcript_2147/g.5613  ORF Transcript_2147/g.5613 Transcript_2147/m.5613 type:complete len:158 (-) Transcript_2147:285-758(-)
MHSMGGCQRTRPPPHGARHGSHILHTLRRYKFTLAVENYAARDYVSERFYQPLVAGSVPVYLGAPNAAAFAPGPGSFIDVRQFDTPEALAAELEAVAADPERYAALHRWRLQGPSASFLRLMNLSMTRAVRPPPASSPALTRRAGGLRRGAAARQQP